MFITWTILLVVTITILIYKNATLSVFTLGLAAFCLLASEFAPINELTITGLWLCVAAIAVFNIPGVRRQLFSHKLFAIYKKIAPHITQTEKDALQAGDPWWEAELFKGRPDWSIMHNYPIPQLSAEERAFIEGPVEQLCEMINDWQITEELQDLPKELWQFLKEHGFFGLIIPKAYGGKEFSALAHSEIIAKITPRSITVGSTVSVLNSLGPAELLMHYGTQEQKNYYLPRLARGEEIPCFALTNPEAGSDATAIPDRGIVVKKIIDGQEVVGINLNWNKRYITLAPIATVLGLAFKLYDPDHILSDKIERDITCALIPVNTPGVTIGRRHLPLSTVFQNGPTQGHDVFVSLDNIIGGSTLIGHGWQMLVECLSVGRAISLPSSATGITKAMTMATGAYARIRQQFGLPIGYFEGIAEVLARMAGNAYLSDAARVMTTSAIDAGLKPAIASAIVKYHLTERGRSVAIDAMDIHGGKGICIGPRNYLARNYQCAPISITVEGANILTRNMIIFSQSLIGCHPYLIHMINAAEMTDKSAALRAFDKAFFGQLGAMVSNFLRAPLLALTRGRLIFSKGVHRKLRRYYRRINRYSAAFALVTDITLITMGPQLKRKEQLCARLGDILSLLYLASCVLKRFNDEGEPMEDLPIIHYIMQDTLQLVEQRFSSLFRNFPHRMVGRFMRLLLLPFGATSKTPNDTLTQKVAQLLLAPNATRDRLAKGVYLADTANNPIVQLETALPIIIAAEPLYQRLHAAQKAGQLMHAGLMSPEEQFLKAMQLGVINSEEYQQLLQARNVYLEIIAVDDFENSPM